jgi:hypothetical protein
MDVITNDELKSKLSREAKVRAQSFALNKIAGKYRDVFLENTP